MGIGRKIMTCKPLQCPYPDQQEQHSNAPMHQYISFSTVAKLLKCMNQLRLAASYQIQTIVHLLVLGCHF